MNNKQDFDYTSSLPVQPKDLSQTVHVTIMI